MCLLGVRCRVGLHVSGEPATQRLTRVAHDGARIHRQLQPHHQQRVAGSEPARCVTCVHACACVGLRTRACVRLLNAMVHWLLHARTLLRARVCAGAAHREKRCRLARAGCVHTSAPSVAGSTMLGMAAGVCVWGGARARQRRGACEEGARGTQHM